MTYGIQGNVERQQSTTHNKLNMVFIKILEDEEPCD